ncbi:hypothetical protein K461DRAFT_220533 [Myriangium duriaei CBS 260.36]|uniref:Uncharacterized protein n=1 Tax=Myriangium duriaei CBS 260.36 TaxID=1168546 RepID=A0A9P4ML20_9PEZI|nr:hypothetical protein K461DRAFT_220533 [Myriangium duriaei CBS 260.36]
MTALPQSTLSSTTSTTEKPHEDGPPSLEYSVFQRKRMIFLVCFWFLVIMDSVFMPIGLYFGLQYGTNLSDNTVFSIVTAALGGVSIVEYVLRFLRLWKKGSTCRAVGARRWHLDFFHWVFSGMWMVVMVELIVGTIPEHPPIRLLAMPATSLLYVFGIQMTFFEMMRLLHLPSPVRVSSQPCGSKLRPGVYSLIEDIVSVDGSGGTAFRERLNKRYLASHVFRCMLERLTIFWAIGAVVTAVIMTALIFTIDKDVAYALGWSVPFIWAGVWTILTWFYVQRMLRFEKETWATQGRGLRRIRQSIA